MTTIKRPLLLVLLVIGGIIIGFVYLIRGCLSKYDERSVQAPIVYAKKDGKSVIFSIVKFEKTKSYSQKGSFVNRSVSTTYFVQNNDVISGKKILEKKVKHHSDIKHYPIEILGENNGTAWIFMGEPMAFDAFTLTEVANIKIIEEKNAPLKGKLPIERRFYDFDEAGHINITANDGSIWKLDCRTLKAVPSEDDGKADSKSAIIKKLETEISNIQLASDSLMKERNQKPLQLLAEKKITPAEYRRMMEGFNDRRQILYQIRDSLRKQLSFAEKNDRSTKDIERKIHSLRESKSFRFNDVKCNADTVGNSWYGLFSPQEMESMYDRVQFNAPHGEAARRKLYVSTTLTKHDYLHFDKENSSQTESDFFLNGGFLIMKSTATPLRLSPLSYIIVHKSKIGTEGTVLLSRVTAEGKTLWTFDTKLKDLNDWDCDQERLIVLGTNNDELSGNDSNLLISIDLTNGKSVMYDFFSDKSLE